MQLPSIPNVDITLGFQVSSLEVPEEESSTSDIGTSFDVCVEIFSGELERSVEVLLSVEDGTAIGVCVSVYMCVCAYMCACVCVCVHMRMCVCVPPTCA